MTPSMLKKLTKTTVAAVMFSTAAMAMGNSALADANCLVTQATLNHIGPRHCDLDQYLDKSKFLGVYCIDQGAAQYFCEMVQNDFYRQRTVQNDGRIRYDADLGFAVGSEGEECGRVIIKSEDDGEVVTQFPQFC